MPWDVVAKRLLSERKWHNVDSVKHGPRHELNPLRIQNLPLLFWCETRSRAGFKVARFEQPLRPVGAPPEWEFEHYWCTIGATNGACKGNRQVHPAYLGTGTDPNERKRSLGLSSSCLLAKETSEGSCTPHTVCAVGPRTVPACRSSCLPYTPTPYTPTPVNPLRMLAFDASGRAALFLFYRPARGADMGGLRDHRASSEAGRRTMEEPSAKRHRVRRPFNSPPCHCVCSTPLAYLLFLPVLLLEEKRILDCSAPLVVAAAHAQLHLLRPTSGQGAHRVRLPCRAPLPKHTLTTHTHALRVEV